jgi:hypothetical protein
VVFPLILVVGLLFSSTFLLALSAFVAIGGAFIEGFKAHFLSNDYHHIWEERIRLQDEIHRQASLRYISERNVRYGLA